MTRSRTVVVVFDGYRGRNEEGRPLVASLKAALGGEATTYWNCWAGPGDSLVDRFGRALSWLDTSRRDVAELNLVALSMGCQVATRLAADVLARTPSIEIGYVVLIAPDPKYRRVAKDAAEVAAGIVSAYDEAVGLWSAPASDAHSFVSALKAVARRATAVRIIYSRADEVAEWDENVELMIAELRSVEGIELIEARGGEVVNQHDIIVDLESTEGQSGVHDRLWGAVRVGG